MLEVSLQGQLIQEVFPRNMHFPKPGFGETLSLGYFEQGGRQPLWYLNKHKNPMALYGHPNPQHHWRNLNWVCLLPHKPLPSRVLVKACFLHYLHSVNLCTSYTFHQDYWGGNGIETWSAIHERRRIMGADRNVDTCGHVIWNRIKLCEHFFLSCIWLSLLWMFSE